MKKFIKSLVALSLTLCCCFGAVACDKETVDEINEVLGQVSDEQWKEMLTFDFEGIDSFTYVCQDTPTYEKEQVEEYGSWSSSYEKVTYNATAQIAHSYQIDEYYVPADKDSDENAEAYFSTVYTEKFLFPYEYKYYEVIIRTEGEEKDVICDEMSKADFITRIEIMVNLASTQFGAVSLYSNPLMKQAFQYDEATQRYKLLSAGTMSVEIQFLNDGISLYQKANSITIVTYTLTAVNTTSVTLPQKAIDVVLEYQQAE